MAIDYFRLARKIAAAEKPPAWLAHSEEWAAVRAIVGGWLATSSVIVAPDSASGFALVDKDTGERVEHEPGVDVGRARPIAPGEPSGAALILAKLTPAQIKALETARGTTDESIFGASNATKAALRRHDLIDEHDRLTGMGAAVLQAHES